MQPYLRTCVCWDRRECSRLPSSPDPQHRVEWCGWLLPPGCGRGLVVPRVDVVVERICEGRVLLVGGTSRWDRWILRSSKANNIIVACLGYKLRVEGK